MIAVTLTPPEHKQMIHRAMTFFVWEDVVVLSGPSIEPERLFEDQAQDMIDFFLGQGWTSRGVSFNTLASETIAKVFATA